MKTSDLIKEAELEGWDSRLSHWRDARGEIEQNQACYADLFNYEEGDLWFLHPFPKVANLNYINWLINSEIFGQFFLTKDAEEGVTNGFHVVKDDEGNWDTLFAGAALRTPFEFELFDIWQFYVDNGFDGLDAFYLMHQVQWDGGWCGVYGISNLHLSIDLNMSRRCLSPNNIRLGHNKIYHKRFKTLECNEDDYSYILRNKTKKDGLSWLKEKMEEEKKCVV